MIEIAYGDIFFYKQKTAYEILSGLVGSGMCIRGRPKPISNGRNADTNELQVSTKIARAPSAPMISLGHPSKQGSLNPFLIHI